MSVVVGRFHIPTSEAELQGLIDKGELRERNELDVKAQIPPGEAANKELARDLASFAVDGGLLIIGIDERPSPHLQPIGLAGVKERVANVAREGVRPALRVDVREIESAASRTDGYVVVIVPPSPDAPHEADYSYWSRSGAGKVRLRNDEVERIRAGRHASARPIEEQLAAAVNADPTPASLRSNAHLFVVARPVAGRPDMLKSVGLPARRMEAWIKGDLVNAASQPSGRWWPDLTHLWSAEPRHRSWALFGDGFAPGREVPPTASERGLLELIVTDDGAIELFCGRGSDGAIVSEPARRFVGEKIVAGLAYRVVQAAGAVALLCDFRGDWDFGLALIGLRGATSAMVLEDPLRAAGFVAYPHDDYRATTRATATEVAVADPRIVDRLVEDLFRVLDRGVFVPSEWFARGARS